MDKGFLHVMKLFKKFTIVTALFLCVFASNDSKLQMFETGNPEFNIIPTADLGVVWG